VLSYSPPFTMRAGTALLRFAVETATSHFRGNHLAAVRQVGEGASLRLDEPSIWSESFAIASQDVENLC
jgi:hypothetical protein